MKKIFGLILFLSYVVSMNAQIWYYVDADTDITTGASSRAHEGGSSGEREIPETRRAIGFFRSFGIALRLLSCISTSSQSCNRRLTRENPFGNPAKKRQNSLT